MNDAWTPFLEWLSHFAVSGLILLPALIFDKVLVSVFGVLIGGMLGRCALVLVIILVWPVVIRMICGQEECRTQKDRLHNGDNTK